MASLIETKKKFFFNNLKLYNGVGDPAVTFETSIKSKLSYCKTYFSPIQLGSGNPSPDNVRSFEPYLTYPIIYSDIGENLFKNEYNVYTRYLNGTKNTWTYSTDSKSTVIPAKPNTQYHLYFSNGQVPSIFRVNSTAESTLPSTSDKTEIDCEQERIVSTDGELLITTTNNSKWLIIQISYSIFDTILQYLTIKESITCNSAVSTGYTCYGGSCDIVEGYILSEWGKFTATGSSYLEDWDDSTSGNTPTNLKLFSCSWPYKSNLPSVPVTHIKANYLKTIDLNDTYEPWNIYLSYDRKSFTCIVPSNEINSLNSWLSYLSTHNLELCYKYNNRYNYNIVPTVITVPKGENTLWSSYNNRIEVGYWAR